MERINREELLWRLHEKDYIRELHSKIREGLVGSLKSEYLMFKPEDMEHKAYSELTNRFVGSPIFRACVDMMVANLVYSTSEKFVHEICDTLEEIDSIRKINPLR